jgi:hypothetical protein
MLLALFVLRVLGQALVAFFDVGFLPPWLLLLLGARRLRDRGRPLSPPAAQGMTRIT